jgi:hypothetical protein
MGLGILPVLVALVGAYGGTVGGSLGGVSLTDTTAVGLLIAGGGLYLAALIAMIVCLRSAPRRLVGLGLLGAIIASPPLFIIGFIVFYLSTGPLLFGLVVPFRLTGSIPR